MGWIVANGVRNRKIKAGLEAWEKVRKPSPEEAKAKMEKIAESAREKFGDGWIVHDEDPEILKQIKLWYFWRKVYTGAIIGTTGRIPYHLT